MNDPIAFALDIVVNELTGCGFAFLVKFGADDRNRAIGLTNYAAAILDAMGEDAADPLLVERVAKLLAGAWHVTREVLDEKHKMFTDDIRRYVKMAKDLARRRDVAMEHD